MIGQKVPDREFDIERLKQLFHYVIRAAGGRPGFGAVKLYKIAWFSDARAFALRGKSITGATYVREEHGPIPKVARAARSALVKSGAISETRGVKEYEGWRFRSLRDPGPLPFSQEEMDIVNYWITHIDEDHTAQTISEESHDYGWEIARTGEELPMVAFLASRGRRPSDVEMSKFEAWAHELGLI